MRRHERRIVGILRNGCSRNCDINCNPLASHIFRPASANNLVVVANVPGDKGASFLGSLADHVVHSARHFMYCLSFRIPSGSGRVTRLVRLLLNGTGAATCASRRLAPCVSFLGARVVRLSVRRIPPAPKGVLRQTSLMHHERPLGCLIVSPCLFMRTRDKGNRARARDVGSVLAHFRS